MDKDKALEFVNERLNTMKYDGQCRKEIFEECIEFLKYARKAIEAYE